MPGSPAGSPWDQSFLLLHTQSDPPLSALPAPASSPGRTSSWAEGALEVGGPSSAGRRASRRSEGGPRGQGSGRREEAEGGGAPRVWRGPQRWRGPQMVQGSAWRVEETGAEGFLEGQEAWPGASGDSQGQAGLSLLPKPHRSLPQPACLFPLPQELPPRLSGPTPGGLECRGGPEGQRAWPRPWELLRP